jgi:hypothetical protein
LLFAGGREQPGPAGPRRALGVAQKPTTSVLSLWDFIMLYPINAVQLYYWNRHG